MEQTNNQPANLENKTQDQPGQIQKPTQELVTAKFKAELSRKKYEQALQALTSYKITEDNMAEAQAKLKAGRGLLKDFEAIKTKGKEDALAECRMWDAAFNSLKLPLETELNKKAAELNTIATAVAGKAMKARIEEERKARIKADIDNTLLNYSQVIAAATTVNELVAIEKSIGSLKVNKFRFEEFLEDFTLRANELTPQIKTQKQAIKDLAELEAAKKVADDTGDDATFLQLEEKKEEITARIEETSIKVQETAINQAIKVQPAASVTQVYNTVSARRSVWEWEVEDIQLLAKKMPHLVKLIADEEKIDELLKTKKADGSLKDKEEEKYFGLRFYLKKTF